MTPRKPDIPGLTLADWQAYRAGTLSPEATRRVEELLLAHPFEADAAEGWDALGAERAAALTEAINRDIGVLSQNEGRAVVPGMAPRHAGRGRVRRMNPGRWAAAAVLMGAMVGGLWFLTRALDRPGDTTALERNDARQEDAASPAGATEALPLSDNKTAEEAADEIAREETNGTDYNTQSAPAPLSPPALEWTEETLEDAVTIDVMADDAAAMDPMELAEDDVSLFAAPEEETLGFAHDLGNTEGDMTLDEKYRDEAIRANEAPTAGYAEEPLTQQVHGKVVDASSGEPLIGAIITLPGTETGTSADVDGRFTLDLPPGDYAFQAQYLGFESLTDSITLALGTTQNVEMALEPAGLALSEVIVSQESRPQVRSLDGLATEVKGGKRRKREGRAAAKSLESTDNSSADTATPSSVPATSNATSTVTILAEARVALAKKDADHALGTLNAVPIRPAGENAVSDQARILQAQAYLLNGNPVLVPNLIEALAELTGNAQHDPARYYLAEARFQLGETEAARILWRALAYENGDWAARARTRLEDTAE